MRRNVNRVLAAVAVLVGAASIERAAKRIESGLRDPLDTRTEAAFKLQRLRTLRHLGRSPRVLIIGASVLDTDLNPAIIDEQLAIPGASFNACLVGSDLSTLQSWWKLISSEVDPEVLIVEAHPAMMLPPGTMAAKLTRQLAALTAVVDSEPQMRRIASRNAFRAGPKALLRAVHSMFARDPEIGVSRSRNRANGYLPAFGHLDFETGSKRFDGNWYEKVEIDVSGEPLVSEYIEAILEFAANVKHIMIVVSPLLLEASAATIDGISINRKSGDQVLAAAYERGIPALDLRRIANNVEDFADPFHLQFAAADRCSAVVANSVGELIP